MHVALLGVTVYALLRIREKRRIDDLLASYGPDVKLPPHLISYVPYLVRVLYCCDNLVIIYCQLKSVLVMCLHIS